MKTSQFSILTLAAGAGFLLAPHHSQAAVAFGPPSIENVALNKPTFGDVAFGAPTSRGNDGITGAANSAN